MHRRHRADLDLAGAMMHRVQQLPASLAAAAHARQSGGSACAPEVAAYAESTRAMRAHFRAQLSNLHAVYPAVSP